MARIKDFSRTAPVSNASTAGFPAASDAASILFGYGHCIYFPRGICHCQCWLCRWGGGTSLAARTCSVSFAPIGGSHQGFCSHSGGAVAFTACPPLASLLPHVVPSKVNGTLLHRSASFGATARRNSHRCSGGHIHAKRRPDTERWLTDGWEHALGCRL